MFTAIGPPDKAADLGTLREADRHTDNPPADHRSAFVCADTQPDTQAERCAVGGAVGQANSEA